MSFITALLGPIGSFVSGFFQTKQEAMTSTVNAISELAKNDASAAQGAAQVIIAEANSESWLARAWRPLFMVIFMAIIISFWFGYVPPNINGPMPPMIGRIFDLIELGMGGYIGGRTLEKVINTVMLPTVLKTLGAIK